jgi:hypothetical protein
MVSKTLCKVGVVLVLVLVLSSCNIYPITMHAEPKPSKPTTIVREWSSYKEYEQEYAPPSTESRLTRVHVGCDPFTPPSRRPIPILPSIDYKNAEDDEVAEHLVNHIEDLIKHIEEMDRRLYEQYNQYKTNCKL